MSTLELCAVLVQMEPVREMKWDPRAHRLVIVTGSERVYVWTPEGASFVQIPLPEFRARTVSWNPYGENSRSETRVPSAARSLESRSGRAAKIARRSRRFR